MSDAVASFRIAPDVEAALAGVAVGINRSASAVTTTNAIQAARARDAKGRSMRERNRDFMVRVPFLRKHLKRFHTGFIHVWDYCFFLMKNESFSIMWTVRIGFLFPPFSEDAM